MTRTVLLRAGPLLLAAFIAVAGVACGSGGDTAPAIAPVAITPTGPQTADDAITAVRDYLGRRNIEGGIDCLSLLEAGDANWTAAQPDPTQWVVTVKVEPPVLLFNVHSWMINTRDARVRSERVPC